jgi:Domain of unknown function (DUF397)
MVESEESGHKFSATSAWPGTGGSLQCVPSIDLNSLINVCWRKSSWSAYNGNCVEVAELDDHLIGVRDTKEAGSGPLLVFGHAAWRSFIDELKNGG